MILPSASRSARPRLWIQAIVPSGRTIRNVLSHESFVVDVMDLVEQREHARTVVFVDARYPRVRCCGLVRREAVQRTESFVPVGLIGRGDPRPGAAGRRFERDAEPLLLLAQRRFGAGALDGVPRPFGDVAERVQPPMTSRRAA